MIPVAVFCMSVVFMAFTWLGVLMLFYGHSFLPGAILVSTISFAGLMASLSASRDS